MKKAQDKTKAEAIQEAEAYIKQVEPRKRFKIIYESVYLNKDLSLIEIGLLFKLITASPDFKPTLRNLAKILKVGKTTIIKGINGLKDKGYLYITKGKGHRQYVITQEPTKTYYGYTRAPSQTIELYNQGILSQEQAKKEILKYIGSIKDDFKITDTDIMEIIKQKWC